MADTLVALWAPKVKLSTVQAVICEISWRMAMKSGHFVDCRIKWRDF